MKHLIKILLTGFMALLKVMLGHLIDEHKSILAAHRVSDRVLLCFAFNRNLQKHLNCCWPKYIKFNIPSHATTNHLIMTFRVQPSAAAHKKHA